MSIESINTNALAWSLSVSGSAYSAFAADLAEVEAIAQSAIAACSSYAVATTSLGSVDNLLRAWATYDSGARDVLAAVLPFGGGKSQSRPGCSGFERRRLRRLRSSSGACLAEVEMQTETTSLTQVRLWVPVPTSWQMEWSS